MAALRALAIGTIALGIALRLLLLVQPIGGDPGIYAYVGRRILAGDLPYRDVFEQKPPGILYSYAAAFAAAGPSFGAIQSLDLIAWLFTLCLIWAVARAIWHDRATPLVATSLGALLINPTLQSSFKQVGQAETFMGLWAMLALWLVLRVSDSAGRRAVFVRSAAAGVACAIACIYKYNAFTYLIAAGAGLWIATRREDSPMALGALLAGFAVPLSLTAGYFWARGGLRDLFEATIMYNVTYTAGGSGSALEYLSQAGLTSYRFVTMNVLWFAGCWGGLLILWSAWRAALARPLPLVAFITAAYVAILLNAKFYPQYFLQILPFLAVSSAWAGVTAWRALRSESRLRASVALVLVLVAVYVARHTAVMRIAEDVRAAYAYASGRLDRQTYYTRFGTYGDGDFSLLADYQMAQWLAARTQADDTVYIYGGEPLVLFMAERRSASRFIWNDPFLSGAFRDRFTTADLVTELEAARPAYFIVLRHDQNLIDPVDSITHFHEDDTLQGYVRAHYRELGWQEDFLVFERNAPAI